MYLSSMVEFGRATAAIQRPDAVPVKQVETGSD